MSYTLKSKPGGFEYTVTLKRIKSVNLRVHGDGRVTVSAPFGVSESFITDFVEKNSARIAEILRSMPADSEKREEKSYTAMQELDFLLKAEAVCRSIEPLFFRENYIPPRIELCRGRSRWGYCIPKQNLVRLNVRLMEYPDECLRYVAMHEYCHFLVQNHSAAFYGQLERRMPDWKKWKDMLRA